MKTLILLSGGYGAGKTTFARKVCGNSNIVSLASPIRSILFKIIKDMRVLSSKQEDKDGLIDTSDLLIILKKDKVKGVNQKLFIKFISLLGEEDLGGVTVRRLLQLVGNAGRSLNKNYWIKEAFKLLDSLEGVNIGVDDVRYQNELNKLKDYGLKKGYNIIHYFIGNADCLYDNQVLYKSADYYLDWGLGVEW